MTRHQHTETKSDMSVDNLYLNPPKLQLAKNKIIFIYGLVC